MLAIRSQQIVVVSRQGFPLPIIGIYLNILWVLSAVGIAYLMIYDCTRSRLLPEHQHFMGTTYYANAFLGCYECLIVQAEVQIQWLHLPMYNVQGVSKKTEFTVYIVYINQFFMILTATSTTLGTLITLNNCTTSSAVWICSQPLTQPVSFLDCQFPHSKCFNDCTCAMVTQCTCAELSGLPISLSQEYFYFQMFSFYREWLH